MMKAKRKVAMLLGPMLFGPSAAHADAISDRQIQQVAVTTARAALGQADADIEAGTIDPRLKLNRCAVPLTARLLGAGSIRAAATVEVACAAPDSWRIYVPMRITTYANVLTAVHPLSRGSLLTTADVRSQRRPASNLAYGYFDRPEQIVGQTLRRPLPADAVISPADVQQTQVCTEARRSICWPTMARSR